MHPKQLLERYQIEPKKSLGQNFLSDEGLLARIVAAAELSPEDEALEVGPGVGALTRVLARAAGRVVAVELDGRLLPVLESELSESANVELVHADVLELDPADWFAAPYVVVANVPYYITGAILRHLLSGRPRPRRLVLTVQREVADRLTARPPEMSLLAVSVQYYGRVRLVSTVKAGAFWPRPEVDSAVVRIDVDERFLEQDDGSPTADHRPPTAAKPAASDASRAVGALGDEREADLPPTARHSPPIPSAVGGRRSAVEAEAAFFRVVRAGFSEKRKQLKNNLRGLGLDDGAIAAALAEAGIDGRRRAETLTVGEWEELTQAIATASSARA